MSVDFVFRTLLTRSEAVGLVYCIVLSALFVGIGVVVGVLAPNDGRSMGGA